MSAFCCRISAMLLDGNVLITPLLLTIYITDTLSKEKYWKNMKYEIQYFKKVVGMICRVIEVLTIY